MSTSAILHGQSSTAGVRRWVHALTRTHPDWSSTILRITLAIVIFPHGAQKVLGWFGGFGISGTMGFLTDTVGLPWIVGGLVIAIEFLSPFALVLGLFSRIAVVGLGAIMVGAVATTHLQNGFFMNWSGANAGEGFEYHLLVLGLAAALFIKGSGALSLDRRLAGE